MRTVLLLLVLAAASCAATKPPFVWQTAPVDVRALGDQFPHALAVILTREDRLVFTTDGTAAPTQIQRHDVIAILAEGGDRWADVLVPVGNGRLQFLSARTIDPGGRVQEVTPEEVHTGVAKTGGWVNGSEVSAKVFRLPNVHVGSVIEYAYGVANESLMLSARRSISAPIPIVHYHAEFAARGEVAMGMHVYNANGRAHMTKDTSQYLGQTLTLDQRDIAATQVEPLAPPLTVTEPYWALTMMARGLGSAWRGHLGYYDTWSHALSGLSSLLYQRKADLYPTAALKPPLDGCAPGPMCIVTRALALVDRMTDLSGFDGNLDALRPFKEVLASKTATNVEKAMLLRRALEAGGVRASFVVLARDLADDFDPTFPSSGVFDHLIVRVDKQPGLDEPLFVDPSCEACAVGQLPSWTSDRQALVVGKVQAAAIQGETPVELVHLHASEPAPSVHRQTIDATIDATGTMNGRITDELEGAAAVDFRIRTRSWLDDRWRREIESDLRARGPTAALRGTRPAAWEKVDGKLSFSADFAVPGYAARDGARQVVPLSFLHFSWDHDFGDEPRHHDVLVREATREEETIVLHLPSGWGAIDLPRSQSWHSDALDAAVNVKSSGGTVTVRRIVQTHAGHWGPAEFDDIKGIARKLATIRQAAFVIAPAAAATN